MVVRLSPPGSAPTTSIGGRSSRSRLHPMGKTLVECRRNGGVGSASHRRRWQGSTTKAQPLLRRGGGRRRSEEHTSELQSLMRISYAVFCLKKKKTKTQITNTHYRR